MGCPSAIWKTRCNILDLVRFKTLYLKLRCPDGEEHELHNVQSLITWQVQKYVVHMCLMYCFIYTGSQQ